MSFHLNLSFITHQTKYLPTLALHIVDFMIHEAPKWYPPIIKFLDPKKTTKDYICFSKWNILNFYFNLDPCLMMIGLWNLVWIYPNKPFKFVTNCNPKNLILENHWKSRKDAPLLLNSNWRPNLVRINQPLLKDSPWRTTSPSSTHSSININFWIKHKIDSTSNLEHERP